MQKRVISRQKFEIKDTLLISILHAFLIKIIFQCTYIFILHLRTKQNKMYDIDSKNFTSRGMKLMLLLEKLHAVLKTAWACHAQCPGFNYPWC